MSELTARPPVAGLYADVRGDARPRGAVAAYAGVVAMATALSFAMVTVGGRITTEEDGPSLKMYQLVVLVIGAAALLRGRLTRVRSEVLLYFGVTMAASLSAAFVFGVATRPLINAAVMMYATVVGAALGRAAGAERTLGALRWSAAFCLLAVVVKAVVYAPVFVVFFASPNGHPLIPTFCNGGPNLEATWVALAAVFFVGSAAFVPYCLVSLAISLLYASRVGVIIVALAVLGACVRGAFARRAGRRGGATSGSARGRARAVALGAMLIVGGGAVAASQADSISYVVQRFQNIGDEPGSLGRLTLWKGGVDVFVAHPFGVGQGNAIPQLEHAIGTDVPESNLHNLYLQHLVETGLPGLLAYLTFGVMSFRRFAAGAYSDQLLLYVLCYLAISTIQFSGGDPLLWFVCGLQGGYAARSARGAA